MRTANVERRLAAIMFTDIVGYTALMAESEEKGLGVRERHREILRPLVEQYNGDWIQDVGDETLSCFPSAVDAVNCALAIQTVLEGDPDLRVRIGIHVGDVVIREGSIHGDGVNIASRIRPLAAPGGICVSDEVRQAVANQANVVATPLGEQSFKNVPRPIGVHALTGEARAAAPRAARRSWGRNAGLGVVAVALAALGWWGLNRYTANSHRIASVAVLPLQHVSGEEGGEYFTDGMTEALISELGKVGALRVISRTSVMHYKGAEKPLPEIARELDVDAVVEGSVLREGNRVRITAQLIRASNDEHLWANSYERDARDVLGLQREIAIAIARSVEARLSPRQVANLEAAPVVDLEAYEAYLKGRHLMRLATPTSREKAAIWFEQALARDPSYAPAYSGLADVVF